MQGLNLDGGKQALLFKLLTPESGLSYYTRRACRVTLSLHLNGDRGPISPSRELLEAKAYPSERRNQYSAPAVTAEANPSSSERTLRRARYVLSNAPDLADKIICLLTIVGGGCTSIYGRPYGLYIRFLETAVRTFRLSRPYQRPYDHEFR
jgi:hypothetical protein